MKAKEFDKLVDTAFKNLPQKVKKAIKKENIAFIVRKNIGKDYLKRMRGFVLAQFTGQSVDSGLKNLYPNKIVLYREDILFTNRYRTKKEIIEHIREIFVHEIAHHFGWKDGQPELWRELLTHKKKKKKEKIKASKIKQLIKLRNKIQRSLGWPF